MSDGLCCCGCGEKSPIAWRTRSSLGWVKGQPTKFINGHQWTGAASRENHPTWRDGRKTDKHGYVLVNVGPDHHLARSTGYALERRLVAEEALGRKLGRSEVVHHINGHVEDNRPENLMVFDSQSEHVRYEAAVAV
jgi:hypothetical protein